MLDPANQECKPQKQHGVLQDYSYVTAVVHSKSFAVLKWNRLHLNQRPIFL